MRRTVILAILVIALLASVAVYASADISNVAVTARVNPAFSMTMPKTTITFGGALDMGAVASETSTMTVKSNKAWEFQKETVSIDPLLVPVLAESTDVAPAGNLPKGITDIVATYDLDLTTDDAYQLEPATDYAASYKYTLTQTP